jgi:hypothetical protein
MEPSKARHQRHIEMTLAIECKHIYMARCASYRLTKPALLTVDLTVEI